MPLLDCNVVECQHNDSNLCSKSNICVGGEQACSSDCTCCDSFQEKRLDSYSSSTGEASRPTSVTCEATNCAYNEKQLCAANQIGINGHNANAAEQTQCATFKPR
ncbi:uncharacterized protein DUF1540 [Lachnotalea glycerini]|jgi:hypothetical protein|uniref:DUF1540 domain-containing protein n=1 Tax=Lachnotalea glycerini TaxID=1763509 RepID=A0A255I4F8_9FIRM|nr:DUF1540 domain-containing protein [Lachnotalea glycerini]OYO63686.1 hypothetical protein CG709_17725 [Lachnotalea glycerini]PXV93555.1 uncharacterized protein DUF1540 [Lachnotalea glycerini]RDY32514.1 DUF1540 domain-containing protein [Lachnotalea glycerini]